MIEKDGIGAEFSPSYIPEQNDTPERFNRTLKEKIRALMFDTGLLKSMWELVAESAKHLQKKFSERAIKSVLVGCTVTGYILWHPCTGKFLKSRHVRFNEKAICRDSFKQCRLDDTLEKLEKKGKIVAIKILY